MNEIFVDTEKGQISLLSSQSFKCYGQTFLETNLMTSL